MERGQQLDIFLYRVLSLREHRNQQNAVFCEESLEKNDVLCVYLTYEGVDQKPVMEVKFMLDSFSRDHEWVMMEFDYENLTVKRTMTTNYDAEMCTLLRC